MHGKKGEDEVEDEDEKRFRQVHRRSSWRIVSGFEGEFLFEFIHSDDDDDNDSNNDDQ